MKPSKKIFYIAWANTIFALLIVITTVLGFLPFLVEDSMLLEEHRIWREDTFLYFFAISTKVAWLMLGAGILITSLKLKHKLEWARIRLVRLMIVYILLHLVEALVKIFIYYPKLSFAFEGAGAIGGAVGTLIGFGLGIIIPLYTLSGLRNVAVRSLFQASK